MNAEVIQILLDLFNHKAPIARTFGMTLSYTDDGSAVFDLPYNPNLNHALGGIHGGIYATMLDNATWFTVAAAQESACWIATSELSVRLLRPAQKTALHSVGRIIKSGKRLSVAEGHLYDGDGQLVGHAVGTFVIIADMPLIQEQPQ